MPCNGVKVLEFEFECAFVDAPDADGPESKSDPVPPIDMPDAPDNPKPRCGVPNFITEATSLSASSSSVASFPMVRALSRALLVDGDFSLPLLLSLVVLIGVLRAPPAKGLRPPAAGLSDGNILTAGLGGARGVVTLGKVPIVGLRDVCGVEYSASAKWWETTLRSHTWPKISGMEALSTGSNFSIRRTKSYRWGINVDYYGDTIITRTRTLLN
jgi:hypothetical protein